MKKRIVAVALTVCMMFGLVACSGDKKQEASDGLKDITFVLDWTPNTNHTGLYAALANGYYEEEGLNVTIVQPPEDGAAVLVASGEAQFGIDFQDYLVPAVSGDNQLPITAVAGIIQHNTSGIVSLKGNGITSPKGMCGKTYATWDLDIEKAIIKYVVEKDGGNFDDVKMIPSTVTDISSALKTDVDAVWIYYAWDGIALETQGVDSDFFYFKDCDEGLDYYSPVIIANNELLENDPETVKAFLRATKKGYEYAMENPDEAADILLEAAPELDKTIVHESQKWLADQYQAEEPYWGYINPERWNAFYDWLYENGVIDEEIPHGTGYTNEFIEE